MVKSKTQLNTESVSSKTGVLRKPRDIHILIVSVIRVLDQTLFAICSQRDFILIQILSIKHSKFYIILSSLNNIMEFSLCSWGVFLAIFIPHIWGLLYFILHSSTWLPALELCIGGEISITLKNIWFFEVFH